jgi:hypothetical protein
MKLLSPVLLDDVSQWQFDLCYAFEHSMPLIKGIGEATTLPVGLRLDGFSGLDDI